MHKNYSCSSEIILIIEDTLTPKGFSDTLLTSQEWIHEISELH